MSLWRNDATQNLENRIAHLLQKQGVTRWVWVVGNSEDKTEHILRATKTARPALKIDVVRFDSEIEGELPKDRVKRLSETANAGFDTVQETDTWWILHESDLQSPVDLIPRFLATGKECVAGWVWLRGEGYTDIFYDVWAFRDLQGRKFTASTRQENDLMPVSSFGSVWMIPAQALIDGVKCENMAVLDVCEGLIKRGYSLWVDPSIEIIQPRALWKSRGHA